MKLLMILVDSENQEEVERLLEEHEVPPLPETAESVISNVLEERASERE